ncbi:MAG: pyridoxal-phosphate dependent enzyme [Candidatus Kapaibacterium sp.]
MSLQLPNYNDIVEAYNRIKNQVKHTPVLTSESINSLLGCNLYFKCENFQKVGAFKFRGASNALMSLDDNDCLYGVATHSSGNHAQALALAAKFRGIPAYIVMPKNSPKVKSDAVAGYGGKIIFCEPTLEARERTLNKLVEDTGATFIHPYDNFNVICGQGTAALELLNEVNGLDIVMTPVGGGGLLSGTSTYVKSVSPKSKIIAAEPKNADDAAKSFSEGRLIPSINPNTIADGLLTSLSEMTFQIIKEKTDSILTVQEINIIKAMRIIWERMKIIIEPSSAVTLAAIMENREIFKGQRVGVILSGGNVDLGNLPF